MLLVVSAWDGSADEFVCLLGEVLKNGNQEVITSSSSLVKSLARCMGVEQCIAGQSLMNDDASLWAY